MSRSSTGGAKVPASGLQSMEAVVCLLATDPRAPTAIADPDRAWRVHVADSLSGLRVEAVRDARRIADVGSGVGFPGLALASALPAALVDLIESVGRKCEFMRRAIAAGRIANARVVCERAESWAESAPPSGGRGAYDLVTARAVGRLSTLAELASPLLVDGGLLVAWKGRRRPDEEAELERAGRRLAMEAVDVVWMGPYAGSRNRHLHVIRKGGPTPRDLPRRPGMAKKRPFGAGA